ncbi:MAG: DUF4294 domain-containing protein [Bacteroidales bacterium]|nr:DUF4294 domain-containing protein [Bacteroidales bacterium]
MRKLILYIILGILSFKYGAAQDTTNVVARAIVINGDTLPIIALNEVKIFGPVIFSSKLEALKFSRLVYHVKKVYPYALIVSEKVKEYNNIVMNTSNKKERKQKMKLAEEELKKQFEDDVKNMNETQGIVLLKLIDRETGSSSFDIIKEFRGGLVAMFYQSFSRLFGYNLKSTYDPFGADKDIEQIVVMLENGEL